MRHLGLLLLICSSVMAGFDGFTEAQWIHVHRIAKAIHYVQPKLDESKVIEYAVGIFRAATRFQVEPSVIISIAQQETSFREDLPEGAAGELGICQVLKRWIHHPGFRQVFPNAKEKDFMRPEKSFHFAAWILSQLKLEGSEDKLPYWSFYNARKYHNRYRYFLAVGRYLKVLRSHEKDFTAPATERAIASIPTSGSKKWQPQPKKKPVVVAMRSPENSVISELERAFNGTHLKKGL